MMDLMLLQLNEIGLSANAFICYLAGIIFLAFRMCMAWKKDSSVMPGKSTIEDLLIFAVMGTFMQALHLNLTVYVVDYIAVGQWVLIATLILSLFNGKAKEFINKTKEINEGPFSKLMDRIKKENVINRCMLIIISIIACSVVILTNLLIVLLAFICLWPLKLSYTLVRLVTCPDCNNFMWKDKRKHMNCDLNKQLKAATKQ
ncbi:hypothetical protein HWV00_21055 (plasmid) [Moritella sp. 24]|uniref:hypothetical protein n=1 Tax=Moritella sp. 24 TaxID=2746230 RepID=UPI001BA9D591|nr:hypothetical protein [Moritella sp. 24]QUM78764.1 hypothetical protein HWV00_21055 [Moritella sp. 24]